jgi:hypothetical protein
VLDLQGVILAESASPRGGRPFVAVRRRAVEIVAGAAGVDAPPPDPPFAQADLLRHYGANRREHRAAATGTEMYKSLFVVPMWFQDIQKQPQSIKETCRK